MGLGNKPKSFPSRVKMRTDRHGPDQQQSSPTSEICMQFIESMGHRCVCSKPPHHEHIKKHKFDPKPKASIEHMRRQKSDPGLHPACAHTLPHSIGSCYCTTNHDNGRIIATATTHKVQPQPTPTTYEHSRHNDSGGDRSNNTTSSSHSSPSS